MQAGALAPLVILFTIFALQAEGQDLSIGAAKLLPDGASVVLKSKVVVDGWMEDSQTARGYMQEQDRSAGIAVILPIVIVPSEIDTGQLVDVSGTMGTRGGERVVNATSIAVVPGVHLPRPLGVAKLGSGSGLSTTGLLIRVWGRVTDVPTPTAGNYPDWYRISNGAGSVRLETHWDDRFLLPYPGSFMMESGISSLEPGGGPLVFYKEPRYEINELATQGYSDPPGAYDGEILITDRAGTASGMEVSAPGTGDWLPLERFDLPYETTWSTHWRLPDPPPPAPVECRVRITTSGRQKTWVGWITGYLDAFVSNTRPSAVEHVFGTLTISWTAAPGGPYTYQVELYLIDDGSGSSVYIGRLEAGQNTSVTYTGPPLQPGFYRYFIRTSASDGNSTLYVGPAFIYGM